MDADNDKFEFDMDIVKAALSRPRTIHRERGTMVDCVQDLFTRVGKNLSREESTKVKEVLVEYNETTFHDPEKPLMRTDTI